MENIQNMFKEWLMTFSSKPSTLSSKKIERFWFVGAVLLITVGTAVYLIVQDKMTALESTILTTPLLVAIGYNISKTEASKLIKKED